MKKNIHTVKSTIINRTFECITNRHTAEFQAKKLSIKLCVFRIGLEYYQNGKNNEEEDEEQEEHIEINLDNNDADDDE